MSAPPSRPWWLGPRMWLYFGGLIAALALAPLLSRLPNKPRSRRGAATGISVLIPERGTPDLLADTLAAAVIALDAVASEPTQLIVVVNGAPAVDYVELVQRHPQVEWFFEADALGYNGAVARGLQAVRHGWTYLLNSDMRLDPRALHELLQHRADDVFSLTSQIFFEDPTRRREETGLSDFIPNDQLPEVYERQPTDDRVQPCLYPGGGSSLLRSDVLRGYVAHSRDYRPFYWEDADWGVQAWRDGWKVSFCPRSYAWHQHRGTVRRYYDDAEVNRIVHRNAVLFDLRHAWTGRSIGSQMAQIAALDAASQNELRGCGLAWRVLQSRAAALRARRRDADHHALHRHRADPLSRSRPLVLLVSPFALFPPSHGGARRVTELLARLHDSHDFVLVSDEVSLYDIDDPALRFLRGVHVLEGRGDRDGEAALSLSQRMQRHAWPRLRATVRHMIRSYQPDVVQIEFMELARLIEDREPGPAWTLSLHDVCIGVDDGASDAEQQSLIARYDAVAVCSAEDAALLQRNDAHHVPNGALDRRSQYQPSRSAPPSILFMGPLRYGPNRSGIEQFLDQVWPRLKAMHADLRLVILGGVDAARVVAGDLRFRETGVELIDRFVDPTSWLDAATLTINPLVDIRGSSLKLTESLLAGRVCLTSADGARGLGDDPPGAAVICADIAAMAEPILRLLGDDDERHRRESPRDPRLDALSWDASATAQAKLYRDVMNPPKAGP